MTRSRELPAPFPLVALVRLSGGGDPGCPSRGRGSGRGILGVSDSRGYENGCRSERRVAEGVHLHGLSGNLPQRSDHHPKGDPQGPVSIRSCPSFRVLSGLSPSRIALLSVLGIVPSSRAALRRRYHVRRDIPSASQGRSASLLPSREALAFLALPVCFADRAACFLIHRGQCQPCGAHLRLYFSICLAVACTSESGRG